MRPCTAPFRLLAALLLAASALAARPLGPDTAAQGLVQIALEGTLEAPGGARIELAVTARVGEETRRAALDLHLAQGTDAHTLAALLAERARVLDLPLLFPAARAGAGSPPLSAASLFFGDVVSVELRLPRGLIGRIVACEDAPSLVRLLPPLPGAEGAPAGTARLLLAATTRHPVTGLGGRAQIELDLPADGSAVRASEQLFTRTVEAGWVADRPSNDAWRPIRVGDSSLVRGLSIEIASSGPDWGLALELEQPRR